MGPARPLGVIPKVSLLLLLFGCGSDGSSDPTDPRIYRVLFIGNSLTYVNDLPGTVARLAASVHDSLVLATQLLDPYIRAAGARPAELMVWPAADNQAGIRCSARLL